MELREFVKNTIADIFGGVVDARAEVKALGGQVVPSIDSNAVPPAMRNRPDLPPILYTGLMLTSIEFDVALTKGESSGSKGGLGVFLGNIGVGGQVKEDETASTLTRIRFSVPVALPPSTD